MVYGNGKGYGERGEGYGLYWEWVMGMGGLWGHGEGLWGMVMGTWGMEMREGYGEWG